MNIKEEIKTDATQLIIADMMTLHGFTYQESVDMIETMLAEALTEEIEAELSKCSMTWQEHCAEQDKLRGTND